MKHTGTLVISLVILMCLTILAQGNRSNKLLAPPGDIIFSHLLHVSEVEVDCLTCHPDAEESVNSQDKILPTMDVCGECHEIEEDEECGTCHRNPDEPEEVLIPEREILFSHKLHIGNQVECTHCHDNISESEEPGTALIPEMKLCFGCHDGLKTNDNCETCHGNRITLSDIHPADWRRSHAEEAVHENDWCMECHQRENDCQVCHQGDNLTGNIHEFNYMFTHGLDAKSDNIDCAKCHDRQMFCVDCHESENRIPLLHSSPTWLTDHGRAARNDVENCASCHDTENSTCALPGCHGDYDGLRGTDPPLHSMDMGQFDSEGPWHDDDTYFCFQCHNNTRQSGIGFCGYCHSE